jgi:acetyl esterase
MGRLPDWVQVRLSRQPRIHVDGQTLDPTLQLFLSLRPPDRKRVLTFGTPDQARARHRRDMLSIRGRPTAVGEVRDMEVQGAEGPLAARLYHPSDTGESEGDEPLLVYFHGGGFTIGDLDCFDEACRILCRFGAQKVLSVQYRLAPENRFPAAVDDALAAFRWAQANAARLGVDAGVISVGGDSAGGSLAAVVAQQTAGADPPLAQLLIYPATGRTTHCPSTELFDGFFLSTADRETFSDYYYRGTGFSGRDPRISPLMAPDLSGLAPALVVTAGFDILRDEGEAYAEALKKAGTPTILHREPSLAHGFIQMTQLSRGCRHATRDLAARWRSFLAMQMVTR